jgi:hypothetical protein
MKSQFHEDKAGEFDAVRYLSLRDTSFGLPNLLHYGVAVLQDVIDRFAVVVV